MQIRLEDDTLIVESHRFTARMEGATLVSVVDRKTGAEFCRKDSAPFPLELVYINKDVLASDKHLEVEVKLLEPRHYRMLRGN